jgi:hypothetical protein
MSALYNNEQLTGSERSYAKDLKNTHGDFKPLNAAEIKAIRDYTGSAYDYINPALRKSSIKLSADNKLEFDKDWTKYADYASLITSGLEKLPASKAVVYRREHGVHQYVKNMRVGQIFINKQFLSSTTYGKKHGDSEVVYRILSETGRWVGDISQHPGENEVLFSPNRMFLITNILVNNNGHYMIHMRELEHVNFSQIEEQVEPIKEEEEPSHAEPEEEGYDDDDNAW